MRHTPGPWTYDADDKLNHERAYGINRNLGPEAAEERGVEVATETIAEICAGPTAEADARLVAAAPDLLAALQAVEVAAANVGLKLDKAFVWSRGDGTQSGGHGERVYLLDTIRAAIAKATA